MIEVRHDAANHRFTAEVEGRQAVLDYTVAGDVMTISHTGVPSAIAGRGIAAELMRAAVDTAHSSGWKIHPACSYAAAYLAKHPQAGRTQHDEDLLDEALEESFPASDSPSVGRSS